MYRRYAIFMAVALAAIAAMLFGVSSRLEPFAGDLSRIGALSEVDFGWNVQPQFAEPTYTLRDDLVRGNFDIVAFGDSFLETDRLSPTWLDILGRRAGASILAVRHRSADQIIAYLESDEFRQNPPDLVVVQSVTRNMAYTLAGSACKLPEPSPSTVRKPIGWNWKVIQDPLPQPRRTDYRGPIERLSTASYYLRKRILFSPAPALSPVRSYQLSRSDLFSSKRSDTLVYYVSDKEGQRVPDGQVALFVCSLLTLSDLAERAGSRFLFVPAPDKSVAYDPVSTNPTFGVPGGYAEAARELQDGFVDTLGALRTSIATGTRDIYLPNDSHWGYEGARVTADAVQKALIGHSVAQTDMPERQEP